MKPPSRDHWDTGLARLLEADAELGHPVWCDRALCEVEMEADGNLYGFHRATVTAVLDLGGYSPGTVTVQVEQFGAYDQPVIELHVLTEDVSTTVPLALADVAPLVAAMTAAAAVAAVAA